MPELKEKRIRLLYDGELSVDLPVELATGSEWLAKLSDALPNLYLLDPSNLKVLNQLKAKRQIQRTKPRFYLSGEFLQALAILCAAPVCLLLFAQGPNAIDLACILLVFLIFGLALLMRTMPRIPQLRRRSYTLLLGQITDVKQDYGAPCYIDYTFTTRTGTQLNGREMMPPENLMLPAEGMPVVVRYRDSQHYRLL